MRRNYQVKCQIPRKWNVTPFREKKFIQNTHTGAVKSKLRQTTGVDIVQESDSGVHLIIENCLFPLDDQHNCGTMNNIFNMILRLKDNLLCFKTLLLTTK